MKIAKHTAYFPQVNSFSDQKNMPTLYSRTSNTNLKKAWQLIALIHSSNSY